MTLHLDQYRAERARIIDRFPVLFADIGRCGFSPPSGWLGIVARLSEKLAVDGSIRCLQVKSKFGGLRYYLGSAPEWAHAAVSEAEAETAHTCEQCGSGEASESANERGWLSTLCAACKAEMERE